jgi:hypothetical protein
VLALVGLVLPFVPFEPGLGHVYIVLTTYAHAS